jgi:hypothetical protein
MALSVVASVIGITAAAVAVVLRADCRSERARNYNGLGLGDYGYVEKIGPAVILLAGPNIQRYGDYAILRSMEHPAVTALLGAAQASEIVRFYQDAGQDLVKGYHIVLQTEYAVALERNE